jgi:geranylgeranyl diphosphate synthase type I
LKTLGSEGTVNIGRLREKFATQIDEVDEALARFLHQAREPATHYRLIRYHFGFSGDDLQTRPQLPRGKRLRAILCMLIGRATGAPPRALTTLMLASEMLHNASLVHDDIQDADPVRWGRPTIWSGWGTAQAINVGDALVGMTFQLLLRLSNDGVPGDVVLSVLDAYVETYLRMAEGQHLDISHQGHLDLSVEQYFDVVRRKTAAALECFATASALIGTARADVRTAYREFGRAFGVLYQICDDTRAIWGEQADTGKLSLHDIVRRKTTLPLLIGVERGSVRLRHLLAANGDGRSTLSITEAEAIADELTSLGVREACADHVRHYRDAALAHLRQTEESSPENQMLAAMVKLCAEAAVSTERARTPPDQPELEQNRRSE